MPRELKKALILCDSIVDGVMANPVTILLDDSEEVPEGPRTLEMAKEIVVKSLGDKAAAVLAKHEDPVKDPVEELKDLAGESESVVVSTDPALAAAVLKGEV